jgi:hypothetical protein
MTTSRSLLTSFSWLTLMDTVSQYAQAKVSVVNDCQEATALTRFFTMALLRRSRNLEFLGYYWTGEFFQHHLSDTSDFLLLAGPHARSLVSRISQHLSDGWRLNSCGFITNFFTMVLSRRPRSLGFGASIEQSSHFSIGYQGWLLRWKIHKVREVHVAG